jgi:hypothetical protein
VATKKTTKKAPVTATVDDRTKNETGTLVAPSSGARQLKVDRSDRPGDLRRELAEQVVPESAAEAAMRAAQALEDEHFEPVARAHDVSMLVDPTGAHEVVPGAQPLDHDVTLVRQAERRARTADVQARMLKGPLEKNVVRPPELARDDLIAAGKNTTDEFRVAASEAAQEDVLDDLHLRRVDRMTDTEIGALRVETRARRQERAERLVAMERVGRRKDALVAAAERLMAEGDSLAITEPDYVTRARHRAESQEQAKNQKVRRTVPMTPEPYHERSLQQHQL